MSSEYTHNETFSSNHDMDTKPPPSYDQVRENSQYSGQADGVPASYPIQSYPTQAPPPFGAYPTQIIIPKITVVDNTTTYPTPNLTQNMTAEQQLLAYQQAQTQAQLMAQTQIKVQQECITVRKFSVHLRYASRWAFVYYNFNCKRDFCLLEC